MMSLSGKVAIVTGGAQGLGKAFSKEMLRRGAKVAVFDVDEGQGKETVAEFNKEFGQDKALFDKLDVTDGARMKECFQSAKNHFGSLDIVINNAGIVHEKEGWEKSVEINLIAVIRGTSLAIEMMDKDTGGSGGVIMNVASIAGIKGGSFFPVYSSTKAAVISYSLAITSDPSMYQRKGIRLNVLAPAFADTKIINISVPVDKQAELDMYKTMTGLMAPEYVATNAMELIEDESKTGQIMKLAKTYGKAYHTMATALW